MRVPVERGKLQPGLDVSEGLLVGNALGQVFEQRRVTAPEAAPLRDQPSIEDRIPVDLEPAEKVPRKGRREHSQSLG